MFWQTYVSMNIQNVLLWLECMLTAPLFNAIVNNVLFHSNSHISQMPPRITHILRFCLVDSFPEIL